jgi:CMP-N,N'-diacetyllegionaminic acid synthase
MINGKRVLAYIPARSGSKGILHKNIIDVGGKPLIAHTIEAAKKSKYVDKLIFSTDSEKYAKIAQIYGAEVPFIRPAMLATDTAKEIDVVLHLISWAENKLENKFDVIIKLQPTSPLRTAEDVDNALEQFMEKNADSVISVNECLVPPVWTNTLPNDLSMKNFIREEIKTVNRQQLPTYYQLNGGVFVSGWDGLKKRKSWIGDNAYAYIMPKKRSVDIDEPIDLELVRILMKQK